VTSLLTDRRAGGTTAIRVGVLTFALLLGSPAAALAASPSPNPSSSNSSKGAAPSTASPKAVYGIGPASATGVDRRPRFKWSAGPGGTLQDHVAVLNIGTTPLTLDLYARDAVNQPDGSLGLQTKAAKPTDAGLWITLEIPHGASTLTVPARSTIIVPVLLVVPRNASPGDHTGGIIVSLTAESTSTGKQALTPNLEQRVAVPVAIRVAGPLQPKLSVQSLSASYGQTLNPVGGGHATVTYKVVNTGNVNLGGHEAVSISGLLGSTAHAKAPDVPVLLPGNSILESVPVRGVLPEFLMSARVTITPLAASGDVDPGIVATSGSKHFWAVPWLLLGIIALLLLGWRQRRRRKRPSTGRHGARSGGGTRRRGSVPAPSAQRPAEVAHDGITVANSGSRAVGRFAVTALAAGLAFGIPAGTALATSLPYTDTAAQGAIGLCDKNGNNLTHGSVYDKPFVWRAVGAAPAPLSVRGSGRNATLFAYQPRKGVDPGNWSGEQLTSTSAYSDPNVPIAQATIRDIALSDYLNDYPPQWDRLVELRVYYGAADGQPISDPYPVADIRVNGTKWTLVTGAKVDCKTGSAISLEDALPSSNPAGRGPAQPLSELAAKAVGAPSPKSSPSPSAGRSPVTSAASVQASSSSRVSSGGHDGAFLAGGAVLVLGIGGSLYWLKRGRS
jgi:hypothetical protein